MLKRHCLLALRHLRRHPFYTFINVAGLAVGVACCLLIALYVLEERSYDRHHEGADRIVRVTVTFGGYELVETSPSILAPLFKRAFPEVVEAVRLFNTTAFGPVVVSRGPNRFQESRFFYADSTVFDVFTLPFLAGSPETALTRPGTIVLTQSAARKYFGDGDPLGQTLTVGSSNAFEVTGVIEDVPPTSHFHFDFLASLVTRQSWPELSDETWRAANFSTYLLLRDEQALQALHGKIPALFEREFGAQMRQAGLGVEIGLQRLTDIYLHHEGHIGYVYLFSAVAFLVLLIACINFMNLSTARAAERAREVGVRKIVGAGRAGLVGQFLAESVLYTLLAVVLAFLMAERALPLFRAFSGKTLAFPVEDGAAVVLLLLGLTLFVGLLAGSYPAFVLSSFRPVRVLKGRFTSSRQGVLLRKGLVVFQFGIVVALLAGTMILFEQLAYVQRSNLGFSKEQVLVLPVGDARTRTAYPTLKEELLRLASVERVAGLSSVPGNLLGGYRAAAEGMPFEEAQLVTGVAADPDVLETLEIELAAGTGFPRSPTYTAEQGHRYLLNETAAQKLGWTPEEAVGKTMTLQGGREGVVVGVMKDFHFASLHEPIGALVFFLLPQEIDYLLVKMKADDVPGTLAAIEQVWSRLASHRPFEYQFLDEAFDALYRTEQRAGRVLGVFTGLSILVACLGLFGLAAFTTVQRTKEIGVRKVLGASVPSIIALLSKDFLNLVLIASGLAVPLAYFGMERWLKDFAYRVEVGPGTFLLAGLLALGIALLTVSYQAVKAALTDPVKTLRYE